MKFGELLNFGCNEVCEEIDDGPNFHPSLHDTHDLILFYKISRLIGSTTIF